MKIAFRVDASMQIGSGHVMRCLTLADALRERGGDVLFISREHYGNLNDLISAKGYGLHRLPAHNEQHELLDWNRYAEWLGVPWERDARDTLAVLSAYAHEWDWLVVDHYALDRRWEEMMRPLAGKIMVVDDLADRQHDCDLLLDQNLHEDNDSRYENLIPSFCRPLTGPRYALLRSEFAKARQQLRKRKNEVHRILVFYGGYDENNETAKALDAIQAAQLRGVEVDVVVGAGNPHKAQVAELCNNLPTVRSHCQIDNMAELMASADLMLCAGGTTTWERCSLGLPGLVTATAANQEEVSETSARHGLSFYLGPSTTVSAQRLKEALSFLCSSPQCLQLFSAKALEVVDGKGVQRVVGFLMPPVVDLRQATMEDCNAIYEWRNAKETRRHIFDREPIPLAKHREWYKKALENPDRILLIGNMAGKPVGVLRYDISGDEALVSVYLVPSYQGQGIGSQLLCTGSNWLQEKRPEVLAINAEVLSGNVASFKAFKQADFKEHHVLFKKVLR